MATHDGFMAFPAFLLAGLLPVLAAATATAEGGRPPRAAVFRAPGFPSADAPAIEDATLATALAGLPVETIDSPSGLASRLKRTDHDVLVLPYGSAFPLEAWPAIRGFVKGGGGLVVLGGAPFHQPVRREKAGEVAPRRTTRAVNSYLPSYPRTATSRRSRATSASSSGGLEGASADELENGVLPFPSQEVDPYRGLAPHLRIASARARALHAMATGQARVVVASAAALLPRVSPPDAILALGLDLETGDDVDLQRLAETLVDAGFTRQDPVDEHGEFCIRGGVVEIFPAGDDLPARIELVGDTIETIRRYAPDTQRSVASTERLKVVPLREVVGESSARVPVFDYLGVARWPVVVACEPDN